MSALFILATFLLFLGMVKYLLSLALRSRTMFFLATAMMFLGFMAITAGFVQRSMATGHGPYTNLFEYCVFGAWAVCAVFLVAEGYYRIAPLGAFMTPIAFLFMLVALPLSPEADPTLPVKAYWLTLHRTLSILAFASFALIFAAGFMYLIQERQLKRKHIGGWYHRLPPLDVLDDINRKGLIFGFPIITVGAAAAMVWSAQNYGSVKIEPSTMLLIAGWVVYAAASAGRLALGWRGRRAARLGVAGFCMIAAALAAHIR